MTEIEARSPMTDIEALIDEIITLSVEAGIPCPRSVVEPVRALYQLCGYNNLHGHRDKLKEAILTGDKAVVGQTDPEAQARRRAIIAFHMGTDLAAAFTDIR